MTSRSSAAPPDDPPGRKQKLNLNPSVSRLDLDLSSDLIRQKISTFEAVREALKVGGYLHADLPDALLPKLSSILKNSDQKASLVMKDRQIVAALPPDQHMLGLAVDLGTLQLGAYLVDLETGQTLTSAGMLNPQAAYGQEIFSHMQFADEHTQGAATFQHCVVEGINHLAAELTTRVGAAPSIIVDCVIAGNTAMHHLLAGLPVHKLLEAPHRPSQVEHMTFTASEIGLKLAEYASVYLPPNIAGLVGGDHIAMLLAIHAGHSLKTMLALDIGSSTEISLLHKGRHLVCSCTASAASMNVLANQTACADIRCAMNALLHEADISAGDLDVVILSGAYGANLEPTFKRFMCEFPELKRERIILMENAAGSGACELLLSIDKRAEAESMPERIEHIELTALKD